MFCYRSPSGSRVYLNDLGPQWREHVCTANARRLGGWRERNLIHDPWEPITPRTQDEILRIIEAINRMGPRSKMSFGRRSAEEWLLFLVTDIERSGDRTVAKGRYVASDEGKYQFSFCSERPFLEPGDLVSVKGLEISFFDAGTMSAVTFTHGDRIPPRRHRCRKGDPATHRDRLPTGREVGRNRLSRWARRRDRSCRGSTGCHRSP
ncbi:hypothetical protein [Microvirga ossetica]|uniref:hypothetical protein n=1 Tax=Microvirga ossetica TaxID=1882682 RepID=UPI0012FFEFD3|nr:hypothetical protein [Microvirga ossetica]